MDAFDALGPLSTMFKSPKHRSKRRSKTPKQRPKSKRKSKKYSSRKSLKKHKSKSKKKRSKKRTSTKYKDDYVINKIDDFKTFIQKLNTASGGLLFLTTAAVTPIIGSKLWKDYDKYKYNKNLINFITKRQFEVDDLLNKECSQENKRKINDLIILINKDNEKYFTSTNEHYVSDEKYKYKYKISFRNKWIQDIPNSSSITPPGSPAPTPNTSRGLTPFDSMEAGAMETGVMGTGTLDLSHVDMTPFGTPPGSRRGSLDYYRKISPGNLLPPGGGTKEQVERATEGMISLASRHLLFDDDF